MGLFTESRFGRTAGGRPPAVRVTALDVVAGQGVPVEQGGTGGGQQRLALDVSARSAVRVGGGLVRPARLSWPVLLPSNKQRTAVTGNVQYRPEGFPYDVRIARHRIFIRFVFLC